MNTPLQSTIRWGLRLAFLCVACLLVTAYFLTDDHRTMNYLLLTSGAIAGFVAGILLSPYDEQEKKWFVKYGQAVSLFGSGFVVAKVDRIFEEGLSTKKVFDIVVIGRWLLLLSSFLLWAGISFVMRRYYEHQHESEKVLAEARGAQH